MFNRLRFTPDWPCAIEHREQAVFDVANEAVSEADGAGGGQYAAKPGRVQESALAGRR
jgi:hypothetical protein